MASALPSLLLAVLLAQPLATGTTPAPRLVRVEYRADPVNVADPRFEYQDTTRSSAIRGAWYDPEREYVIVGVAGAFYHHCRVPVAVWRAFKTARSFGRAYNARLRRRYDCRLGGVPDYSQRRRAKVPEAARGR